MSFIPELVGDGPQPRELTAEQDKRWDRHEEAVERRKAAIEREKGQAHLAASRTIEMMIDAVIRGDRSEYFGTPADPVLGERMHQHFFIDSGFNDLCISIDEQIQSSWDKCYPEPQQPKD